MKLERNARIRADAETKSYGQLAAEHGLSRQRVHQIAKDIRVTGRTRVQVCLNAGTDPEAAAARIRERLGQRFADQLRCELQRLRDTPEKAE